MEHIYDTKEGRERKELGMHREIRERNYLLDKQLMFKGEKQIHWFLFQLILILRQVEGQERMDR